MSIATYSELKTAVANWLDRSDLTTYIPDYITMAEAAIGRDLRIRQMEGRKTASISTEYVDIPTDFIEARNIQLNTTEQKRLKYVTPEQMDQFHPEQTTGEPKYYTIIGTEFQFKPIPDTSYTVEIAYYARFAALSGANDTNWLLTNMPEIYLYASLVQASPFLRDDDRVPLFATLYQSAVDSVNKQDKTARYSGATLRMQTDIGDP